MSNAPNAGPLHPIRTGRSGHSYFFYVKHHARPPSNAAQWLLPPRLTADEEFAVFDLADEADLADDQGNLHGLRPREDGPGGPLLPLGTRHEQVARFPFANPGVAWHGYPIWPIDAPRDGEKLRSVPAEALDRMVAGNVIDDRECRRLKKGRHI